jgi:hypothetical protein
VSISTSTELDRAYAHSFIRIFCDQSAPLSLTHQAAKDHKSIPPSPSNSTANRGAPWPTPGVIFDIKNREFQPASSCFCLNKVHNDNNLIAGRLKIPGLCIQTIDSRHGHRHGCFLVAKEFQHNNQPMTLMILKEGFEMIVVLFLWLIVILSP